MARKSTPKAARKAEPKQSPVGPLSLVDLGNFGQATVTLEVARLTNDGFGPPISNLQRRAVSLGSGEYRRRHLELAQADLSHLTKILKQHPDLVLAAVNALTTGDHAGAVALALRAGLSESEFRAAEGGYFGLLILVAVILISLPGDSPVPTAKEKAQSFTVSSENAELMDGLLKK